MRNRGSHHVTFNVGAVVAMTILPAILTRFSALQPEIKVTIGEGTFESSLTKLRSGTMDFMIALTTGVTLGKEFTVKPILTTGMTVTARKGHPYADATSLSDLLSAQWILTPDDEMDAGGTHHIFSSQNLPMPEKTVLCLNSSIGVPLVCESALVGAMAAPFLKLEHVREKVSPIAIKETLPPITYSMIYRSDIPLSPSAQLFEKLFHRNFPDWGWTKIP